MTSSSTIGQRGVRTDDLAFDLRGPGTQPFPLAFNTSIRAEHGRPPWLQTTLRQVLSDGLSYPQASQAALAAMKWMLAIPAWVSRPHVGASDDGTFSVEWRTQEAALLVMFDESRAEAFYESDADEWETDLDSASDKMLNALRAMS